MARWKVTGSTAIRQPWRGGFTGIKRAWRLSVVHTETGIPLPKPSGPRVDIAEDCFTVPKGSLEPAILAAIGSDGQRALDDYLDDERLPGRLVVSPHGIKRDPDSEDCPGIP